MASTFSQLVGLEGQTQVAMVFIVFGKSVACVAEIKSMTAVLVFCRMYGRELPPVVHDSLGMLGFCLGYWEEDVSLGPYARFPR